MLSNRRYMIKDFWGFFACKPLNNFSFFCTCLVNHADLRGFNQSAVYAEYCYAKMFHINGRFSEMCVCVCVCGGGETVAD